MNYPLPQPPAYQPQYPQAPVPQQGYPVQPAAPQYPGYPAQPAQGYAPQPYAPYPPQAPAAPPLAQGSIDDFYNQPTSTSGPGVSWKNKPIGTTYVGLVSRDVVQGDIVQDQDFTTKQPKFQQGRPVFVMKVPLQVQPCQEFPEGEFTFYVRGQAREELVRAMAQAGLDGAPKAGALIQVTLVQRKPNRSGNPTNVVQIGYTPDYGQIPQAPAPVQPEQPQYAAPVQYQQPAPVQQPVQQYAQPPFQPAAAAPPVQYAAPAAAAPSAPAPQAPQAPVQQFAPPAPQQAQVPQPPANLDPAAQAILSQLTAPAPAPAQG